MRDRPHPSLALLRAVPTWAWLGSIVLVAAGARWGLALAHVLPSYIPDEYLYSSLGHSLGEHGTSAVRGEHAAFPALLQPLLTAPLWLVGDVSTGLGLVKALNAVAMASSALPLYLLARRVRLTRPGALFCALLGAVSPNLYFVSFVLSNPISYPLALGAAVAAVAVLEQPTKRAQLGFLALAGLAAFASIQFIILPAVLLGAAVVVERGHLLRIIRQLWLTIGLLALGSLTYLVQPGLLGFYRDAPQLGARLGAGSWLHWTSLGALLLAVSAGACFVPGAVAAVAQGIARPRERCELAFSAFALVLSVALLTEAASIELQSGRFEERYLLVLAPLLPIAFLLWQRMHYPLRSVAVGVAAVILLVLPFVPLSTYALRFGASASPFLGAVAYLERFMSVSRAGLVVAVSASSMALLALVIALRPTRTAIGVALGAGLVWLVAVSAGSTSLANHNSEVIRAHSPADLSWVDRLGVRDAVLVSTFGSRPYEGTLTLFWNPRAFGEASTLGRGLALDAFGTSRLRIARDGRLLLDRRVLGRPFLLDREGTLVRLSGATRVASVGGFTLWRPAGAPRVRLLAEGFYADGRLAQSADVQLWPDAGGSLAGTLRLTFEGLPTMPAQHLTLSAPGLHRTLNLRPGERKQVALAVRADGPYALRIVARNATGYNGGPLTAGLAATPVFVPAR